MKRVLWGCALTAVTLKVLLLQYLLPAIGLTLMLLGFRTLRRENGWFRLCYVLTVLRCALAGYALIRNTTVLPTALWERSLGVVSLLLLFAVFFALWKGLRTLQDAAGVKRSTGSAAALLVWYGVICVLAFLNVSGLLSGIILVIAYALILRNLFRLSGVLDEAGYAIQAAPVRLSDRWMVVLLGSLLATGVALGYRFGGSYPMDWSIREPHIGSQVQAVKKQLAGLGFPEEILEDLTDADLLACAGARRVVVDVMDHPANRGREVTERRNNGFYTYRVYDAKELRITGIAVELSGERESWKIIQHFQWLENPGFYGTESIQLWPACRLNEGWSQSEALSGRVLYDEKDRTYAAPYAYLGEETYTSNSVFWGAPRIRTSSPRSPSPTGEKTTGAMCPTRFRSGWTATLWTPGSTTPTS